MSTRPQAADGANSAPPTGRGADDGRVDAADEELARQLAERARAEGVSLTGPGGLLGRLTKVVLESALEGEMDAHLGYRKHDPAGNGSGNSRPGPRPGRQPGHRRHPRSPGPSPADRGPQFLLGHLRVARAPSTPCARFPPNALRAPRRGLAGGAAEPAHRSHHHPT